MSAAGRGAVAMVVLAGALCESSAQTWETVFAQDGPPTPRAILMDPLSPQSVGPASLILAGDLASDGTDDRVFRLVQDPLPAQLTPLDDSATTVYSLAANGAGDLYGAGSRAGAWVVRRSPAADAGGNWADLMSYQKAPGKSSRARGLVVDGRGVLHACGMGIDEAGYSHWLVQSSTDGGQSWSENDLFRSGGVSGFGTGLDVVEALGIAEGRGSSAGALFVVGTVGKRYYGSWTVTRSLDQGASWQVVDTSAWVPKSLSSTSRARKVATDAVGRVFVLGDTGGRTEVDPSPWALRMSASAGDPGSWVTLFGPWRYGPCPYPLDLTIDALGNVWMAGVVHNAYGKKSVTYTTAWTVVRLHEEPDGIWTPTVYFPLGEAPGTYRAAAQAITADDQGRVFVSGNHQADDATPRQWMVQRFEP